MLRVHFTTDDLGRTYVAKAADPLWEVVLSNFTLHERTRPAYLQPWVRRLRTDLDWSSRVLPGVRIMADLAPQGPYFPDFLTPAESESGLESGLEAILRTPQRRLAHELNLLATHGRRSSPPPWLNSMVSDTTTTLKLVTTKVRDYYDTAIAPHHDLIKASIDSDRAYRARSLLDGGIEGMFNSLRPLMDWQPPVLHVQYDVDQDLHLRGRGLRLVPSFFCHGSAVAIADPELPPVLIYPIANEHRWLQAAATGQKAPLQQLLGATRANVLWAIGYGATTTELARALRTSPASISRHTGVLRDSGLVSTQRHGPAVLHTLTALGIHLLEHNTPTNP